MRPSVKSNESGMAIITALLVLMLASGLMAGMFAALIADQKSHATDRDQSMAYAAAHAGLEKLTSNLGALFDADFSPSAAQVGLIDNFPPTIPNFQFVSPGGGAGSGYQISFPPDPGPGPTTGNPLATVAVITTGNWEGLRGLITPYTITVTARSSTGNSEVRLRRELQTVAVPVFQFGIFGQNDLGFHAGPNFDFGGRVHTNASLYLASGTGSTLTFRDKITAFTQVKRDTLINGAAITTTNHTGSVSVPTDIGTAYRNLASTESSGTIAAPWSGWDTLSKVIYKTNIRTQATGAKQLNLPLAQAGAQPVDLLRRPVVLSNENTVNPAVYTQRYYGTASVRILLSDRLTDLTGLPTATAAAPVQLEGCWNPLCGGAPPAGYVVGAGRPELARSYGSPGIITVNAITAGPPQTVTLTGAAIPNWLRVGNVGTPNQIMVGGIARLCTGAVTPTSFAGCPGPAAAIAAGTAVSATMTDGFIATTTIAAGGVAVGATTYNVVTTAGFTPASRMLWADENPFTCTGYSTALGQLTGCTSSGNAIAVGDVISSQNRIPAGVSTIGGFIKIERRDNAGNWTDVTMELLALGFAAPNQQGGLCPDPTPNAVIRIQRLRDTGLAACTAANYGNTLIGTDYWPNMIFDARESSTRLEVVTDPMRMGGLFSYIALDVNNFRRWVTGAIGATGNLVSNNDGNGFIVYFSDRRGNHDPAAAGALETGEYGFEDSLNPLNAVWAKDNVLNGGEDFNQNATLQSYGETPWNGAGYIPAFTNAPFDLSARPWTQVGTIDAGRMRVNRQPLFRRALKLVNGGMVGATNNVPAPGFTVASENPVYVQGNFNATTTDPTAEPNVGAAIMADSITLLSNAFQDVTTFRWPNDMTNRNATETAYRFAMITGKALPFAYPGWGVTEWGSDGGVHNFMRMLEDWSGQNLRYRGSMVSLFFSRQAIGPYRADANVYSPPTRGYNFDVDFLTPALLPPGTPAFRDINTLKFRQILRPNQ